MPDHTFTTPVKITPASDGVYCGDCEFQYGDGKLPTWKCQVHDDAEIVEDIRCDACFAAEQQSVKDADLKREIIEVLKKTKALISRMNKQSKEIHKRIDAWSKPNPLKMSNGS